jgi:hypothetical protein
MEMIHLLNENHDLKLENLQLKNQNSNLELELENAVTYYRGLEEMLKSDNLMFVK